MTAVEIKSLDSLGPSLLLPKTAQSLVSTPLLRQKHSPARVLWFDQGRQPWLLTPKLASALAASLIRTFFFIRHVVDFVQISLACIREPVRVALIILRKRLFSFLQ